MQHATASASRGIVVWVANCERDPCEYHRPCAAATIQDFISRSFASSDGLQLIVVSCGVGFLFALIALCISVVAFRAESDGIHFQK
ncbi:hypothetical protein ASC80_04680 [Afipia sp. Root123D2]|uniref:DUF2189 domain-containing protein n=1 Tax=Afipia sp. Root123D2 TaxID=1736436 RepID=UPI0006FBFE85|nr:DUF2189 domain-containing protein [Afipia sp. Root123D2]KQW22656.1 hypothetical protein ASC80_04680 [Afipia sp. Root123D2]